MIHQAVVWAVIIVLSGLAAFTTVLLLLAARVVAGKVWIWRGGPAWWERFANSRRMAADALRVVYIAGLMVTVGFCSLLGVWGPFSLWRIIKPWITGP
jgi:hypothetical protein